MQTLLSPFRVIRTMALLSVLSSSASSLAQAPHPLTASERDKIGVLLEKMTLDQKLDYIGGTGFSIRAIPSLGLPAFEMSDGPYGTRSNAGLPSTTYSAGIGLAASWDRKLAAAVGGAIGRDARARGVHFMLGPGVNIYRSPLNGRNFEYFGEDPFLASAIATNYIVGMQQQGVSATVKHFAGNNSEFLRHDSDSQIDERTLREIYLPAFEAAVTVAHVGAVMDSYNLIDGRHATQNPYLNVEILRDQWHFPGLLMSDWDATYSGIEAAMGGLDMEMPTGKFMNRANLAQSVHSGALPESVLDDKIRHVLGTAFSFNWLDRPQLDPGISYFDSANRDVALQSAREGAVLLKNEQALLPLDRTRIKTILVVGPDAYPGVPVGGGSAGVTPFHTVSALEGITNLVGGSVTVLYDRGLPTLSQLARTTTFTTQAAGSEPGLTQQVFSSPDLSGSPAATFTVPHIDAAGLQRSGLNEYPEAVATLLAPANRHLSSRYTGFYAAASSGPYLVVLEGSGEGSGNRVSIDGKLVIDNWDEVRAFQPSIKLHLTAGPHSVVVEERHKGALSGRFRFAIAAADSVVNPRARDLASRADAVVVAAGFQGESEGEAGDRTFSLPFGQEELISSIAAANPRTIVTLTSGGNVDSTAWISSVPAILETWYGGQEGGRALAEILFGDVNPSGHLPATFERRLEDNPTFGSYYPSAGSNRIPYREGIFVGYRGYLHNQVQPLFPFGFGLSYTTFKLEHLKIVDQQTPSSLEISVAFDVTNTGKRSGAEVAQLYVSEDTPQVPRAQLELKGFERVELAPGESKHASLTLDARSFAFFDVSLKKWVVHPGKYTIHLGDSVVSTPLSESVRIGQRVELP